MPTQSLDQIFAPTTPSSGGSMPNMATGNSQPTKSLQEIFGNSSDTAKPSLDSIFNPAPKAPEDPNMIRVGDTNVVGGAVGGALKRAGSDIQSSGQEVANAIQGEGQFKDQGTLQRATGAVSEAFSAVPKVASEVLPEAVRSAISGTGKDESQTIDKVTGKPIDALSAAVRSQGLGGIVSWLGDKLGSIPLAQDFVTNHPDAAKNLEGILGTTANVGNTAGTIAMAEGVGKGAPKVAAEVNNTIDAGANIAKPAIEQTAKVGSRIKNIIAPTISDAEKIKNTVGQIIQGTPEDIAAGKRALTSIDSAGIKTQQDLMNTLDKRITELDTAKQARLTSSPVYEKPLKLGDWEQAVKVGDSTVQHNYVEDGLNQLKDYYTKTNDIAGSTRISNLIQKGEAEGLTINEVDAIAKEHGIKLNAFNANGELASGLTKQAAENTRTGIKATAREVAGDPAYKAIDSSISDTIKTRDLIKEQVDAVNKLQQKIKTRTLGEKIGRTVGSVVNLLGMNSPKGFIEYFLGRGTGLKTLNALDIQATLQKNLKILNDLVNKDLPEKTMIDKMQEIIGSQSDTVKPLSAARDQ